MVHGEKQLMYQFEPIQKNLATIHITIPSEFVDVVYKEVLLAQKMEVNAPGFPKGNAPLSYIEQNYRNTILDHVTEFLFKYFVIQEIYTTLRKEKVLIAGEPRLQSLHVKPHEDARFTFEVSCVMPVDIHKWKSLPFKAPRRKNYKDIDRQVESFIKDELSAFEKAQDKVVELGDWVGFDIQLLDTNEKSCFGNLCERFWLHIGDEEADLPLQEIFLNKQNGQSFCTKAKCLQNFFSSHVQTHFNFSVTIHTIVKNSYFCIDHLKRHFRLKSNKDVHKKLIEVFSYRNDLSLRRSMAEDALKLLVTKHSVEAPNYLILRQQKQVLDSVYTNPDFQVYKTESNFEYNVRKLAEKQVKEMLIIDQLSLQENLHIDHEDITGYLNLMKRPRTKEFVYFVAPETKLAGQELPINNALLEHCCMREKTLNHVIYHLTKK
jgi:trigger factor